MYAAQAWPAPHHPLVTAAINHLHEVWADREPVTFSICYPTDCTCVIHTYGADGRRVDARSVSLVTV
ncbi:MAG: hypothetical protein H0U13_04690 [Gemmatimonadaceae bacterium]|nr:hypothetical protein [Gemmatimonadaceae bacterium]